MPIVSRLLPSAAVTVGIPHCLRFPFPSFMNVLQFMQLLVAPVSIKLSHTVSGSVLSGKNIEKEVPLFCTSLLT